MNTDDDLPEGHNLSYVNYTYLFDLETWPGLTPEFYKAMTTFMNEWSVFLYEAKEKFSTIKHFLGEAYKIKVHAHNYRVAAKKEFSSCDKSQEFFGKIIEYEDREIADMLFQAVSLKKIWNRSCKSYKGIVAKIHEQQLDKAKYELKLQRMLSLKEHKSKSGWEKLARLVKAKRLYEMNAVDKKKLDTQEKKRFDEIEEKNAILKDLTGSYYTKLDKYSRFKASFMSEMEAIMTAFIRTENGIKNTTIYQVGTQRGNMEILQKSLKQTPISENISKTLDFDLASIADPFADVADFEYIDLDEQPSEFSKSMTYNSFRLEDDKIVDDRIVGSVAAAVGNASAVLGIKKTTNAGGTKDNNNQERKCNVPSQQSWDLLRQILGDEWVDHALSVSSLEKSSMILARYNDNPNDDNWLRATIIDIDNDSNRVKVNIGLDNPWFFISAGYLRNRRKGSMENFEL